MKTCNIYVDVENTEKIDELLSYVQKNCRARLVSAWEIQHLAEGIEAQLDRARVTKRNRKGIEAGQIGGIVCGASYKGVAYGTAYKIRRGADKWFLVDISREECKRRSYGRGNWVYSSF